MAAESSSAQPLDVRPQTLALADIDTRSSTNCSSPKASQIRMLFSAITRISDVDHSLEIAADERADVRQVLVHEAAVGAEDLRQVHIRVVDEDFPGLCRTFPIARSICRRFDASTLPSTGNSTSLDFARHIVARRSLEGTTRQRRIADANTRKKY